MTDENCFKPAKIGQTALYTQLLHILKAIMNFKVILFRFSYITL